VTKSGDDDELPGSPTSIQHYPECPCPWTLSG